MIKFSEYIKKKVFGVFIVTLLVLIIVINATVILSNKAFINKTSNELNESFVENLEHLVIEHNMDISIIKDYAIHYSHTNHVELAIYDSENKLLFGKLNNRNNAIEYKLFDHKILIDRDTSILSDINNDYLLIINLLIFITFIISIIIIYLISERVGNKVSNKLSIISSNIETINDGNYDKLEGNDIVEIEQIDNTLKNLNNKLNQSKIEKENLINELTHEIKTPMTVIRSNVEGIIDGVFESKKSNQIILSELDRINRLIEKINTISSDDAIMQSVNISKVLNDSIKLFDPMYEQKNIHLKKDIEENVVIKANKEYLNQIFTNLLSNIYKYTFNNKRAQVSLHQKENYIIINFENEGILINGDELSKVFNKGFRSEEARKLNEEGKGIGLNIVKTLVEYHDGTIKIDSSEKETNVEIMLKIHN